jgi:hypothetical protein
MSDRLLKEVAAPFWYALKSLVSIMTSEEAILQYVGMAIDAVLFIVDCYDLGVVALQWAIEAVGTEEEPVIETSFIDENLYLMPSHDSFQILAADVEEVLAWWQSKASQVCEEVMSEYWETHLLVGAEEPKILPEFRKRVGVRRISG